MQCIVGDLVKGKVVGIKNFGAFIELEDGKNCLVHISEISDSYVKEVSDHLKIGDLVTAKVISIDENGKIGLSIKQANLPKAKSFSNPPDFFAKKNETCDFEEMMHSFKQASDEKMSMLKRSSDPKRSAAKRRK